MKAFLEEVAEALVAAHGHELQEVAVVLPGQRAGLYLRRWLARLLDRPLWSPGVFTLDTFLEHATGLQRLPPEQLLFEAYEAYRTVVTEEPQSLGEFLQWAPTMLADISEADAHLVPLDGFYRDLRSWAELDWSFNDAPLSHGQERMVQYWALKGRLHAVLNARLLAQRSGTAGGIARAAAEHAPTLPWRAVWFAGLNALTPAEERAIVHVQQGGRARFVWDADRYYLNDVQQEAGEHLRKAIARFGPGVIAPIDRLATRQVKVNVVRTPNAVAQAWYAGQHLAELDEAQRGHAAVVLADAPLLTPLLEALPAGMGPLNITMGLPLAQLPAASLIDAFLRLHSGYRPGIGFFRADVEHLLRHPFLDPEALVPLLRTITSTGRAILSIEALRTGIAALPAPVDAHARVVFDPMEDAGRDMPVATGHLLAWAQQATQQDAWATEQLYQVALLLQRLHALLARHGQPMDHRSYASLVGRLMRSARIGLFGEPLSGTQVMGLLETRALDLEHVVVLGAQEGVLPTGSDDRSFIPFELRRAYGLPVREGTDAVQAYHFLRMVQRAREVTLVHSESEGSAGPSRFILQLQHELYRPDAAMFPHSDVRVHVPVRTKGRTIIAKDELVLRALRDLLAKGLTPTQLGEWLRCPLDFYFRRILRLREPPSVGARIDGNVLGEALHRTIEDVYRPWLSTPIDPERLEEAAAGIGIKLKEALRELLPGDGVSQGQPLLQTTMAAHAAERFLRHEARSIRQGQVIVPQALELDLAAEVPQAQALLGSAFRLKGRLDRVDERNDIPHVLDLKTGRVDPAALILKELSVEALRGDKRYAAQLLVYAWLYFAHRPDVDRLKAGLQPMQRSSGSSGLFLRVDGSTTIDRRIVPEMDRLFLQIAERMLDPAVPIEHDVGSAYCAFCIDH